MSETKHTPGPWSVEQGATGSLVFGPPHHRVGKVFSGGGLPAIANARLIAAAPETRKALIDLCKEVGRLLERNDYIDDPDIVRAYESALASLRKVEGE